MREVVAATPDIEDAVRIERAFAAVIDRVAPSVVGLRVQRRYFADVPGDGRGPLPQIVSVNGSGVVIDADGLILTNEHVIQSAAQIEVVFHDGRTLSATPLAGDPRSDLAVLRVARRDLPAVRFCDWAKVRRGQWSLALGNPFGLATDGKPSVSVGVISNLGRRLPGLGEADDRLYHDMLQTTTPIHPGNSGGPLFNINGELVGIVTAMHVRGAEEGAGFAVPMNPRRREIIRRLSSGLPVEYGFAGVSVRAPRPDERLAMGVERGGVLVQSVTHDGPAAAAGVQIGDVLIAFDGESIVDEGDFVERVGAQPVGRLVQVQVQRRGKPLEATLTIAPRQVSAVGWLRGNATLWRGLRLGDLPRRPGEQQGTGGVIVLERVEADQGLILVPGDVITAAAGQRVRDVLEFRRVVADRGHEHVILLTRDGRQAAIRP